MSVNIKLLEQQHLAIISAIDHLLALTERSFEEGYPHIASARLRLSKVVADNMATETAEIHEPLEAYGLKSRILAYNGIAQRTRELRLIFSASITKWSSDAIKQDWAGYGASLRHITTQLADILLWEERELFPHADMLLTNVRARR